jgi:CRP-like cAMP-binding protein
MHPDPDRLSRIPLFEGLSQDDLARLASWFDVEDFEAGRSLAREGTSGYSFFVLHEGTVRVEQEGRTLRTLSPGDVFGEMAFFGDGRRTANVVSETDVRVLWLFGTRFREIQLSMPELGARLEALARERSRPATDA